MSDYTGLETPLLLDALEAVTGWTVLGNDTDNLAAATKSPFAGASLEFDKVDGAAGTIHAGAYKSIAVHMDNVRPDDIVSWWIYVSATTDVAYAWLRLGSDSSNYTEYRFADTSITAGKWTRCKVKVGEGYVTGEGADFDSDLAYMAIGVAFDAEDDTLADINVWRAEIRPVDAIESV